MGKETEIMLVAALTIGFFHTLLGPDHYVPFAAMAQARGWSKAKTFWVTVLCGLGHVASSVILGIIGIIAGVSLANLKWIESARGEIATWFLIGFGLVYFAWSLVQHRRNQPHRHSHVHQGGGPHSHGHTHQDEHLHVHAKDTRAGLTPWVLFIIFFFGPCEPLIPLVMYPALKSDWRAVFLVVALFGTVTLLTMLGMVFVSVAGLDMIRLRVEKHFQAIAGFSHAIAGLVVLACGVVIKCFGL